MRPTTVRVASLVRVAVAGSLLLSSLAFAEGTAVLTGTVIDAATNQPVRDVVVTATSPALQGEQIVVTDATGLYRIPQLPPGQYTLRLEGEGYKPFSRSDINLRVERTIRLNVQLQPESIQAEEVVVVGRAPTVDIGSMQTGVVVGKEFINNVPFIQPNSSGTRSFESLAQVAPQVNADAFGFSMNGTTSPENGVLVDGLSVTDPAYGGLQSDTSSRVNDGNSFVKLPSASIPVEFIEEVNVVTGGYLPEFGRSTGGILSAVTKSGGNEFHGSIFGTYTPGAFSPEPRRILREESSFEFNTRNWNTGDFGVEIGGPIVKDRVWFYAGFAPSMSRERIRRTLHRVDRDANGDQRRDEQGEPVTTELPGTTEYRFRDARAYNYIAKLTFLLSDNQRVALSLTGAPRSVTTPKFNPLRLAGTTDTNDTTDLSLKYTASFFNKNLLIDAIVGWHHQEVSQLPDDGSQIGSSTGAAGTPSVIFRKYDPGHSLLAFERLNPEADAMCRDASGFADPALCPGTSASQQYTIGGASYMEVRKLDRIQAKATITYLLNALGHHVFKAGIDYARSSYFANKDYGGGNAYRESVSGSSFRDYRRFGYFTSPDVFEPQGGPGKSGVIQTSTGNEFGAFLQDSWSVLDLVTVNAGIRYDTQQLYAADGTLGMTLNNMFAPRVGLIYDFTQRGQSKVYASYARYYQSIPLSLADRGLTGEFQGGFNHTRTPGANGNGNPGCQPLVNISQTLNECLDERNNASFSSPTEPSQQGYVSGVGKSPVDPNLQAQSSDEYIVGGEYELIQDGRVGVSYTHRNMNYVIEDMSRDEATTYFLGNPGYGIASDFPKAVRDYDAVSLYFTKAFSDQWQAQLSYTWSYLRGNYAGLFRPETEQLNPNINSDFDLQSLLANRMGPLPGDTTHVIKAYGAKEFVITGAISLVLGLSYTGRSGQPISYLASHPIYGEDETFVLPRGSAGRTPWVHQINGKLMGQFKVTNENTLQLSVDIFNMFNFAAIQTVDQSFSGADILPYTAAAGENPQDAACISGDNAGCVPKLRKYQLDDAGNVAGTEGVTRDDYNPNFKRVTSYQQPISVRFGIRLTF